MVAPDGSIDRQLLSAALPFYKDGRDAGLKLLEQIVHPLVLHNRTLFVDQAMAAGEWLVVVDIPLLFETCESEAQLKEVCDVVLVVSAPREIQRQRVLKRPGMTPEKFAFIDSKQVPDSEKCKRADFVINTGYPTKAMARAQLARCYRTLVERYEGQYRAWLERGGGPATPIRCVTLDLDDCLWPVMPPIIAAQRALLSAVEVHLPKSFAAGLCDREAVKATMAPMFERHPMLAHDFTELRRLALEEAAVAHGDDPALAEQVMEAFLLARSDVSEHIFSDVLPAITKLRQAGLTVGAMTNGNCDVTQCLHGYFDFAVTAGEVGAAKPDPLPFLQAAGLAGCHPHQVVHVGDSPLADVCGAMRVGSARS